MTGTCFHVPAARIRLLAPTVFVTVNAVVFWVARPGVPDIWAARARAAAASDGVGVTYWFGWFGGSSPGNYSVFSPLVNAALGTELVIGLAAAAVCALATALLRGTTHSEAGSWVAAFCIGVNLWCGRAPFLLGAAVALTSLLLVRRRQWKLSSATAAVSVLVSPVSGAFLVLGLSGLVLTRSDRGTRRAALAAIGGAGCTLVTLAALFGSPGPEPLSALLSAQLLAVLGLSIVFLPKGHVRLTAQVTAAVVVLLAVVPNGMGSNVGRFVFYCLPVAAVAMCGRRTRLATALVVAVVTLGGVDAGSALVSASRPGSAQAFYAPLIGELDHLHPTSRRLEITNGAHAAYAILLGHAVLARGWETQEDTARNAVLQRTTLDASTYRRWLDANAVGYVATVVTGSVNPETLAARAAGATYLHEMWHSQHWRLYEVSHSRPIVAPPGVLESSTQSTLTLRVSCACRTSIRIRWSRFLEARPAFASSERDETEDASQPTITPSADGWTALITRRAGSYVLSGS